MERGSDHPDVNPADIADWVPSQQEYLKSLSKVLRAHNKAQYEAARLETGLTKPCILLGLPEDHTFGVPGVFGSDFMHLPALNVPDLLYPVWRAESDMHYAQDFQDRSEWPWAQSLQLEPSWQEYGPKTAASQPYFPGWYDRFPRDPEEKMSSGYKAWEYMILLYGLGPMDPRPRLPEEYWTRFCKLVCVFDILGQEKITATELQEARELTQALHLEFENLYVKRCPARGHFVRIFFHSLLHMPNEVLLKGPTAYYSQWTIERVIGILKEDLRLHSNPFSNLPHIVMRLAQTNALCAMVPGLETRKPSPQDVGEDLGDNYYALHPRDQSMYHAPRPEAELIDTYIRTRNEPLVIDPEWQQKHTVRRFGRLALPNGSIARTAWRETLTMFEDVRIARMVEVSHIELGSISLTRTDCWCRCLWQHGLSMDSAWTGAPVARIVCFRSL
jgi:hypothetical protein